MATLCRERFEQLTHSATIPTSREFSIPESAMSTQSEPATSPPPATEPPRSVAVIDIGTTSLRMAIGEIHGDGGIRTLETLLRAVAIGKDTFTNGTIERATIEDCVRALTSYREVLDSYGIKNGSLRCVATSAVREASNRLAFVDRIYIATGIQVEILDEAEVSRVTFLGIQPTLREEDLAAARSVVVEVGGGSTEVLVVHKSKVEFSQTYNLGSLRLRETLGSLRMPVRKQRQIMENQIGRFVHQAVQQVSTSDESPVEIVVLGSDCRFAAGQLVPNQVEESLPTIPLESFEEFVDVMFRLPIDEIVHDYHLTYPDAEALAPALLTVLSFARSLGTKKIRISNVNLRDGLLQEMANQGVWSEDFTDQVLNSALDIGHHYAVNENHATHVAHLAGLLFDAMNSQHRLENRYRVMLKLAAMLHEIGLFVGIASYHKHTMYLIQNSELFGLSRRDLQLVAQVARYHRRASPSPNHSGYARLSREDRVIVSKLASILRVAAALDRSYSQRIRELTCEIKRDRLIISVPGVEDLSLEQIALKQSCSLFEETYGISILLR